MQGLIPSTLTLVLFTGLAAAEGPHPSPYAPANNPVWRPSDTATTPSSAPEQYQQPAQAYDPSNGQYPYQQPSNPYPGAYPQNMPESNTYSGQPERYDSGYYTYPPAQPYYWEENPYPSGPQYPGNYYPAQPYNYPYVYEVAPPANEYSPPQAYGYPQGYGQEYYYPSQPMPAPGYESTYQPGHETDYNLVPATPVYSEAPYGQNPGYAEPPPYPSNPPPAQNYAPGYAMPDQGTATPQNSAQYPRGNDVTGWRPDSTVNHSENIPQQAQRDNALIVNGAPAVFRPWVDPSAPTEQGTKTD